MVLIIIYQLLWNSYAMFEIVTSAGYELTTNVTSDPDNYRIWYSITVCKADKK